MEKAIIFGLGNNYYVGYDGIRKKYDIVALTDNNASVRAWAGSIKLHSGIPVIAPDEMNGLIYDCVVITTGSAESTAQITGQLKRSGVPADKIRVFVPQGVTPFLIDPMFYETGLTYEQKKLLFANNCEHVTIEPNSRCNRKCWFCPNSVIDRHSQNIFIKPELFDKIVAELKEIDYNGMISYSFYNEPLLDDGLEDKIAQVKRELPMALQLVSTNGDHLTPERLASLINAGIDDMVISVYNENDPEFEWTCEKAEARIYKFINALSLDVIYINQSESSVSAFAKKGNLNIRLQNHDLRFAAHNRGEILSGDLPLVKREARRTFCMNSFVTLNVYYDGSVYSCGNRRNDYIGHIDYCIGNVADNTIFDIFQSEAAQRFRKNFTSDPNQYPCRSCTMEAETFIYQFPTEPVRDRPRYTRKAKGV